MMHAAAVALVIILTIVVMLVLAGVADMFFTTVYLPLLHRCLALSACAVVYLALVAVNANLICHLIWG